MINLELFLFEDCETKLELVRIRSPGLGLNVSQKKRWLYVLKVYAVSVGVVEKRIGSQSVGDKQHQAVGGGFVIDFLVRYAADNGRFKIYIENRDQQHRLRQKSQYCNLRGNHFFPSILVKSHTRTAVEQPGNLTEAISCYWSSPSAKRTSKNSKFEKFHSTRKLEARRVPNPHR